ncbi:MAG: hypothetical protein KID00_01665 [Clostridium argentinense]|uniref:NADPH-dependent FMN reductase-like domain-containing protein n=1 Tax=Clostridium faecium TaxID=2762223 RepID=A0ABR8YNU8_9CLOT|nr:MULTISPECIES: hypothetical protein [Clostridium]MBD8045925.1 hypothetical protein [Clostridium faecium]MBS5822564.1 hypothetical protein [Clostridium argentinense]MDU1348003.1 hypothetical protein [Clostridium argentinense]
MNVLLLSFSGRKESGNCIKILEFIQKLLLEREIKCTLLNIVDLNISPCLGCNYECFNKKLNCSIKDDVEYVYKEIVK